MKKYIIREVEPEACDFSFYFEDDGLTEKAGDFCYTLFIVYSNRYGRYEGFNIKEYLDIRKQAEDVLDGFQDVKDGAVDYDGNRITCKTVMTDCGISYNSTKCHALKEWAENADIDETEDIAAFLSIITGKEWAVTSAHGYSQGDYCEVVYCTGFHSNPKAYGEIWLGAGKEFCVIDIDENGNEIDPCYGYIVADCEAWKDEDYKRIVSNWACISEDEAQLEMIDSCSYSHSYSYRIA